MKIVHLAPVLLVSFILAACGGGGGGSSTPPPDDMTMKTCADQGKVGTYPDCMDPGPTAEEIAAATAAAATKRTAIEIEAAVAADSDEGLGGTGAPTDAQVAGEYNLSIEYGDTSITVEGTTADDNETFMQAMDFEDGRTMHTRTMDADADGNVVSEVVIVSTDIAAPTAVPFAMFELADGTTPQALNARDLDDAVDADNDGTATNDWTALNVVAANIAQIMSGGFSSSGSGTLNYANDDASTDNMDEAFETAGTYNGASGTYRCNGTSACSITYDAMGMITSVAGDWVFTPDAGATSDQPDYDYLHYGFWLQRTTDSDDAVTYNEVQTFAGSSIAGSGSTTSVRGSATYSGGAVGVYVREAYKETDGSIDTATSGHFIANVALTATFGQVHAGDDPSDTSQPGTIAPNMLNTLTGTINNFMLSNGEANEWSVNLQGAIDDSAGTASGAANGGGTAGTFSATFHGSVAAATDGSIPKPSSVVGEFNANFGNGIVAGGFGAR